MLVALKPFRAFLAACLLVSALALLLGSAHAGLIAGLCLLILIAGLPHGAFDLYIMAYRYQGQTLNLAIGVYLGLIALTVLVWLFLPLVFLTGFLAYSAYHFGDSDWPGTSLGQKLAWGVSIVGLPCLIASNQVAPLFETITGLPDLSRFTAIAGLLAIPACLLSGLSWMMRRQSQSDHASAQLPTTTASGLLLLCYALACALSGPLAAFACYFACLHGPFHLDRWQKRIAPPSNLGIYALSTLVIGCVGALAFWLPANIDSSASTLAALADQLDSSALEKSVLDDSVLRYTFVTLAALTVPHMTLLMLAKR